MSSPKSLYIFTTSQNPLPGRYPRPTKPVLVVPPLIHRSLHQALDQTPPSLSVSQDDAQQITIPHIDHLRKHDIPSASDRKDVEITLKIHLVAPASSADQASWVKEALSLVQTALGIGGADTLLIGFKGVDYKGKKTVDGSEVNGDSVPPADYSVSSDMEEHIVEFWTHLVDWLKEESEVKVKTLGTMYLPFGVLKRLKSLEAEKDKSGAGSVKVNSLDTPDCHHLPKDFTGWAKENGVQLWAGGGGEGSGKYLTGVEDGWLTVQIHYLQPNYTTSYRSSHHTFPRNRHNL
jgi:hypothetical protein